MTFKYVRLGALFNTDPAEARAQLAVLFESHDGNMSSVARDLEVDRVTVYRWCKQCVALRLGDPRVSARPTPNAKVPIPAPSLADVRSFLGEHDPREKKKIAKKSQKKRGYRGR